MNFFNYAVLSTLVLIGAIAHTFIQQEFFYPTLVALSQEKLQLAVVYNFLIMLAILAMKIIVRLFVGRLNAIEVEQLIENGRSMVADTLLFLIFYSPTVNGREMTTISLVQNIGLLIALKVFHSIAHIRTSRMFEVGIPSNSMLTRVGSLLVVLITIDSLGLYLLTGYLDRTSTFYTWLTFEFINASISAKSTLIKFSLNLVDAKLTSNGWPSKSVYVFYTELIADILQMSSYILFMGIFFYQNPARLPIYAIADIVQVARQLGGRLKSFQRYRAITADMETKFPNATEEEIGSAESCIICRDTLTPGCKVLQCGHIFHAACLRSWVLVQQICPTCRSELKPRSQPPQVKPTDSEVPVTQPVFTPEPIDQVDVAPTITSISRENITVRLNIPAFSESRSQSPVIASAIDADDIAATIAYAKDMAAFYVEQAQYWSAEVKGIQAKVIPPNEPQAVRRVLEGLKGQVSTPTPPDNRTESQSSSEADEVPTETDWDDIRKARQRKYEEELRLRRSEGSTNLL